VAFRTQDELSTHVDIEHKARNKVIKANALLGFEYDKDESPRQHKRGDKDK
jgi:hypothetical protein